MTGGGRGIFKDAVGNDVDISGPIWEAFRTALITTTVIVIAINVAILAIVVNRVRQRSWFK